VCIAHHSKSVNSAAVLVVAFFLKGFSVKMSSITYFQTVMKAFKCSPSSKKMLHPFIVFYNNDFLHIFVIEYNC